MSARVLLRDDKDGFCRNQLSVKKTKKPRLIHPVSRNRSIPYRLPLCLRTYSPSPDQSFDSKVGFVLLHCSQPAYNPSSLEVALLVVDDPLLCIEAADCPFVCTATEVVVYPVCSRCLMSTTSHPSKHPLPLSAGCCLPEVLLK